MRKIDTEIIINASAEKVWQVLSNFEEHQNWNPFIKSIKCNGNVGDSLTVTLCPPGGNAMTFKPTLLKFDENKELRWKGKVGIKGIFDGEHYFIIEKISDSQTKFIHGEIFSGILVGFMKGILDKSELGFALMNEALKVECER